MNDPNAGPHPFDDDVDDANDLPPEVQANVIHAPPPSTEDDAHGIYRKVLAAHLDGVIGDLGNALRRARAAREALGND